MKFGLQSIPLSLSSTNSQPVPYYFPFFPLPKHPHQDQYAIIPTTCPNSLNKQQMWKKIGIKSSTTPTSQQQQHSSLHNSPQVTERDSRYRRRRPLNQKVIGDRDLSSSRSRASERSHEFGRATLESSIAGLNRHFEEELLPVHHYTTSPKVSQMLSSSIIRDAKLGELIGQEKDGENYSPIAKKISSRPSVTFLQLNQLQKQSDKGSLSARDTANKLLRRQTTPTPQSLLQSAINNDYIESIQNKLRNSRKTNIRYGVKLAQMKKMYGQMKRNIKQQLGALTTYSKEFIGYATKEIGGKVAEGRKMDQAVLRKVQDERDELQGRVKREGDRADALKRRVEELEGRVRDAERRAEEVGRELEGKTRELEVKMKEKGKAEVEVQTDQPVVTENVTVEVEKPKEERKVQTAEIEVNTDNPVVSVGESQTDEEVKVVEKVETIVQTIVQPEIKSKNIIHVQENLSHTILPVPPTVKETQSQQQQTIPQVKQMKQIQQVKIEQKASEPEPKPEPQLKDEPIVDPKPELKEEIIIEELIQTLKIPQQVQPEVQPQETALVQQHTPAQNATEVKEQANAIDYYPIIQITLAPWPMRPPQQDPSRPHEEVPEQKAQIVEPVEQQPAVEEVKEVHVQEKQELPSPGITQEIIQQKLLEDIKNEQFQNQFIEKTQLQELSNQKKAEEQQKPYPQSKVQVKESSPVVQTKSSQVPLSQKPELRKIYTSNVTVLLKNKQKPAQAQNFVEQAQIPIPAEQAQTPAPEVVVDSYSYETPERPNPKGNNRVNKAQEQKVTPFNDLLEPTPTMQEKDAASPNDQPQSVSPVTVNQQAVLQSIAKVEDSQPTETTTKQTATSTIRVQPKKLITPSTRPILPEPQTKQLSQQNEFSTPEPQPNPNPKSQTISPINTSSPPQAPKPQIQARQLQTPQSKSKIDIKKLSPQGSSSGMISLDAYETAHKEVESLKGSRTNTPEKQRLEEGEKVKVGNPGLSTPEVRRATDLRMNQINSADRRVIQSSRTRIIGGERQPITMTTTMVPASITSTTTPTPTAQTTTVNPPTTTTSQTPTATATTTTTTIHPITHPQVTRRVIATPQTITRTIQPREPRVIQPSSSSTSTTRYTSSYIPYTPTYTSSTNTTTQPTVRTLQSRQVTRTPLTTATSTGRIITGATTRYVPSTGTTTVVTPRQVTESRPMTTTTYVSGSTYTPRTVTTSTTGNTAATTGGVGGTVNMSNAERLERIKPSTAVVQPSQETLVSQRSTERILPARTIYPSRPIARTIVQPKQPQPQIPPPPTTQQPQQQQGAYQDSISTIMTAISKMRTSISDLSKCNQQLEGKFQAPERQKRVISRTTKIPGSD